MELTININEERKKFAWYIFVIALEGGIGYWSECTKYHWMKKEGDKNIDDINGFFANIIELDEDRLADGEEQNKFKIDYSVIEKGLKAICNGPVKYLSEGIRTSIITAIINDDAGEIDADYADGIVQVGLFNEVVYG